jgi:ABC-type transport system involved in cytochrome c biogenesis permease component
MSFPGEISFAGNGPAKLFVVVVVTVFGRSFGDDAIGAESIQPTLKIIKINIQCSINKSLI